MGFILATIGSAIGVSNVWRFSYLAYKNGGGAFLLPYAIALLTVGIPLLIVEQSLGHEMRGSAPAVFRKIKQKFEVFGWWPVVILVFGLNLYYAVILSDCINYFALSATLGWGDDPNAYFFHDFLHASHDPWVIGLPVLAHNLGSKLGHYKKRAAGRSGASMQDTDTPADGAGQHSGDTGGDPARLMGRHQMVRNPSF